MTDESASEEVESPTKIDKPEISPVKIPAPVVSFSVLKIKVTMDTVPKKSKFRDKTIRTDT